MAYTPTAEEMTKQRTSISLEVEHLLSAPGFWGVRVADISIHPDSSATVHLVLPVPLTATFMVDPVRSPSDLQIAVNIAAGGLVAARSRAIHEPRYRLATEGCGNGLPTTANPVVPSGERTIRTPAQLRRSGVVDARAWADAYVAENGGDRALMVAWFASALMAGVE